MLAPNCESGWSYINNLIFACKFLLLNKGPCWQNQLQGCFNFFPFFKPLYCESQHSRAHAEGCFFLLCSYGESNAGAKLETFSDPFGFQQAPDSIFHLSRSVS